MDKHGEYDVCGIVTEEAVTDADERPQVDGELIEGFGHNIEIGLFAQDKRDQIIHTTTENWPAVELRACQPVLEKDEEIKNKGPWIEQEEKSWPKEQALEFKVQFNATADDLSEAVLENLLKNELCVMKRPDAKIYTDFMANLALP